MPMTVCPPVPASATHSIAQTWVTMMTAPGRAAVNRAVSLAAWVRMPASRAARRRCSATLARSLRVRTGRRCGGCSSYRVVVA